MHQVVRSNWGRFNLPFEGSVSWMYLDVRGLVTTAVGNKIDQTAAILSPPSPAERDASLEMANRMQWHLQADGSPATAEQVAADWDAVKARLDLAASGHRVFEDLTALRLTEEEIARVVDDKLHEMESALTGRPEFNDFADWPANAQLATLSMCWALGPAFNFPSFEQHVAEHAWASAAEECQFTTDEVTHRIRNELDRMHFLLAQAVVDQELPIDRFAMSTADVLGVQHSLWLLGFDPGAQTGADGPRTQDGVRAYQAAMGIDQNGSWDDPDTQTALAATLTDAGFSIV